jgi:ABC-type glycerol-3-phosphate transport system substrate-binding protein
MATNQSRRRILHSAILIACLFLVACASVSPPSSENLPAPIVSAPVILTLWHTLPSASETLVNSLAAEFHDKYPSIVVRIERRPNEGEILRQGLAAIALNQAPDLVLADDRTLAEFGRRSALVNLEPLLGDAMQGMNDEERADFFPGFLDTVRFRELKNQMLAFPFERRAVVLYYNADLLKSANVQVPRTWDQFGSVARATTRGNVRGWAMSADAMAFYAMLFSRGGNILNDSQTLARFGEEAGLKSLQTIVALTKGGSAYLVDSTSTGRDDFVQGKTALWIGSTDDLATVANAISRVSPNRQWGVTNLPQDDPAHPFTAVVGNDLAIFKRSEEHVRAAWLLIRWLTLPEQSARWSRTSFCVPVRLSAQALLAPDVPPSLARLRDGFGDTLPTVRAAPIAKDAALIDSAIVEMWTSAANGLDPAAALKNASARVNRILGNLP